MRKTIAIAMLVIASLSLFASDHQDVSISFGNGMYRFPEKGISFSYGLNLGLTERLEMGIWGISEAVPMPIITSLSLRAPSQMNFLWAMITVVMSSTMPLVTYGEGSGGLLAGRSGRNSTMPAHILWLTARLALRARPRETASCCHCRDIVTEQ